ncbi:MAG: FHA domain-containing protein [Mycetocola sp.]
MTGYSYAPARTHEWLAIATAGRLLVTKVDPASDRVAALTATGHPDTSVQQVLEVLTAQGLAATGPFALLFWVDGDLKSKGLGVIVRGEATVTVDTADGPVAVSSRGVTTWTEQVIEAPTGFRVDLDQSTATPKTALPLHSGAAWVSMVSLAHTDASISGPASTDARPATQRSADPAPPPTIEPVVPSVVPDTPAPAVASGADAAPEETRVFHTSTRTTDAPAPVEAASDDASAEADGYDYLFGATVFRPVGAAAVEQPSEDDDDVPSPEPAAHASSAAAPAGTLKQPAAAATAAATPPAASAPVSTLGDHDGRTMLASDILAARKKSSAGHAGPPAPAPAPPGARYRLELPDGTAQALTAPVILGRAPSVSNVPASVLPHLVTLTGDDISRSHLRVAVEGDTVVVTDLHSSNGTHVIAPGKLPQLLRAGEPTPVITGTVIDLGSDIVLTVSEA